MLTSCWEVIFSVTQPTREVNRLGSTVARLKLKGIDGDPHKRWMMWINSMQREKPYLPLTCQEALVMRVCPQGSLNTGAAWLSSARVVRCWVKSRNERNPRRVLPSGDAGNPRGTAAVKAEEGGDDVKSSCPLCPGLHTCYNGRYRGMPPREGERIPESRPQFGLGAATRPHEVGVASNRGSACRGECVPGPCTHRPSHHPSRLHPKSPAQPRGGRRRRCGG